MGAGVERLATPAAVIWRHLALNDIVYLRPDTTPKQCTTTLAMKRPRQGRTTTRWRWAKRRRHRRLQPLWRTAMTWHRRSSPTLPSHCRKADEKAYRTCPPHPRYGSTAWLALCSSAGALAKAGDVNQFADASINYWRPGWFCVCANSMVPERSWKVFFCQFRVWKSLEKNFFGLLQWKKKKNFQTRFFDIHFLNILFKIDIILLISC